jgi:outer membrane immunogenic protein
VPWSFVQAQFEIFRTKRENMFRTSLVFVSCAAALATPAVAANFVGPRAELRAGWDKTTITTTYHDTASSLSGHGAKSGLNLGLEVGYDAPVGQTIIAGAYAGVEGASTKECSSVEGNDQACLKIGRNFTLGARVGAKVSSSAMLYIKGGYSNGRIRGTYHNFTNSAFHFSDRSNRSGYHFGVGGELAVGQQGYVRAEYVHTNYKGHHFTDATFRITTDGHRDQALVGFGMRF